MKSNSISLEDELKAQDKRCKLLLTGECLSLVLSGVGTVVTAITKEAVFAATPLTFSLFLNILSRAQQDKRIYDQTSQNLIEVQRQSASKIQGIRSEFLGMDFSEDSENGIRRSADLDDLASKVKQLEAFLEIQGGDYYSQGGAVNQEVSILRNHQLEMAEAIETLTNQINGSTEAVGQAETVDQTEILDHLDRLSAAVYELEQKTAAIANHENSNDFGMNTLLYAEKSDNVSSQLEPIQSQMMALEERMNFLATADPAYEPESLQKSMEELVQPLRNQIVALENQVSEQQAQVMPAVESTVDGAQLDAIQATIATLQEKLDSALSQISTDISDFQNSLNGTHVQMGEIQERMNSIQEIANEAVEAHNPEAIQRQVEAVHGPLKHQFDELQVKISEYAQLQGQLDQLHALAQQSMEQSKPEVLQFKVTEATAPLMDKISALEGRIQTQSASQDIMGKLHQVIEPLQSHMVSLEQRINQISSEGDRTPLLQKIAALQGQLQNFEDRLASMPNHAEAQSAQIHELATKIADMQSQLDSVSTQVSQDLTEMPHLIETTVQEKEDLLSELQALSFEEEMNGQKQETKSELDDLLNTLNF